MALRRVFVTLALAVLACCGSMAGEARADAPWCAPELEALPGDACVFDGARAGAPRTLVVFLHGIIEPGTMWQHAQQRGIVAAAKRAGFVALMPKGRWTAARKTLEARAGRRFDEVMVVGFSNGAYYTTSLALRGRLADVDGYAAFAGGGAAYLRAAAKAAKARAPFFLGIATHDKTTVNDARALAKMLHEVKWPARVEEKPVGHAIPDGSLDRAIAWIRQRKRRP